MSHKLFDHSILSNARVWAFLTQVDAAEAQASREAGCLPRGTEYAPQHGVGRRQHLAVAEPLTRA